MNRKLFTLFAVPIILAVFVGLVSFSFTAQAVAPTPTPELDADYHWNLEDIYPGVDEWEADFKKIEEVYIPLYGDYEGNLGDADTFIELMEMDEDASRIIERLYVYAYMKMDEDQTDSQIVEMAGRIGSLYSDLVAAGAFARPELIALPEDTLQSYLEDERMKDYHMVLRHILDQKAHTLSKEEEALLAQAGDIAGAASTISTKIREADLQFPTLENPQGEEVQLSEANYVELLMHPDRQFREQVYKSMLQAYGSMQNSLAAALDAQMRTDAFYAAARKYESSVDAALAGSYIPEEIYTELLDATDNNIS